MDIDKNMSHDLSALYSNYFYYTHYNNDIIVHTELLYSRDFNGFYDK